MSDYYPATNNIPAPPCEHRDKLYGRKSAIDLHAGFKETAQQWGYDNGCLFLDSELDDLAYAMLEVVDGDTSRYFEEVNSGSH